MQSPKLHEEILVKNLYDLSHTLVAEWMEDYSYPWEVLPHIKEIILEIGASLSTDEYEKIGEDIWIHRTAKIADSASITGPAIIGADTEVRHCAYIRGNVIAGEGCVMGNSCEFKNSILFDGVQTPHYNYVGDSVLGYKSHMGAGSITSNVKSDKKNILVHIDDSDIETGLRKFGAMIGDHVEIGCGSVLNPGCVIGRNTNVYPLSSVRGFVRRDSIYKKQGEIVGREET